MEGGPNREPSQTLQNSGSCVFCRSNGQPNGAWQVIELAPVN